MEGCVQVHKLGMSDSEGTATMSLNIKNSGAAHIISNGGDIIITTIDNFCKSKKVEKIDFIKIDVEGYELFVLRGGENIIRKSKPVLLIEINPPTLKRIGLKPRDVIDRLKYHGYNLYVPNRKKLTKLNNLPGTENYIINVFCLPDHISLRLT
jgi:hypothetical protein